MGRLLSIPAERPFLASLARTLLREPAELLADHLILLPSRRACLELRDVFLELSPAPALLLPRLQPVGEVDLGDLPLPLAGPAPDLLPPIDPLRRRLLLARLVKAKDPMPDEQAIRLATALAELLDMVQTEQADLGRLAALLPGDLAEHWQEVVKFLGLLDEAWPTLLQAEGASDPAAWRNARLEAAAAALLATPPAGPVIAAGITGTVPAVADLLAAVLELDGGMVVLPGFDPLIDGASYEAIGPTHPYYPFRLLLDRLGRRPGDVAFWPDPAPARAAPARTAFLAEIMRPAATAEAWQNLELPAAALAGLEIAECDGHAEEALLVALKLRAVLEQPGRRAALVTPDRQLARRVAAELARWQIEVDDSGGVPLDQTPPGSFILLTAHAFLGDGGPVPLLSALKHPLARGGLAPGGLRRLARLLDRRVLRGARPAAGIRPLIEALPDDVDGGLRDWLAELAAAADPLLATAAAGGPFPALIEAHLAFVEWLAADATGDARELWAKETGEAARDFLARLLEAADGEAAPAPSAYPAVLAVLMGAEAVRPRGRSHERLMILGQLEARLVEADTVVIAGLNEGTWPRTGEPGPWLNRHLRQALGLPPVELSIGIAAHDLFMAASAPEVLFTRAAKDPGGAPTVASRWLQRLDAVTKAVEQRHLLQPALDWQDWQRRLDAPEGPITPCPPPEPRPPAAARPRELWVTDIERLMRDPYSIYARRILGLKELDPLDADPGASDYGQLIHEVLQRFVQLHPQALPADAEEEIVRIGLEAFARLASRPEVRTLWWPRFRRVAGWFIEQERARRGRIERILVETRGSLIVDEAGRYTIRARADRLEIGPDGAIGIGDYKTGSIPRPPDIARGLNPQLPLEAAIARGGGFEGASSQEVAEIAYWPVKASLVPPRIEVRGSGEDLGLQIEAAVDGVRRLFAVFDDSQTPYFSVPRPEIAPAFNPYEHLARIKEWRGGGD
jgi:ATP-dependent helicase/nuclease subunit B